MATSVVEIGANALRLLGADPITSLDDPTERARLVQAFWPMVRQAVLRAHPWGFATRFATLARLAEGPAWRYRYAYQLPTQPYCVRVIETSLDPHDTPWIVSGRTIVTDATSVKIAYVADVTDPGEYDTLFASAVTARLAAELAYPVTASVQVAAGMWQLYQARLAEARHVDSLEASPQRVRSDDLIRVR